MYAETYMAELVDACGLKPHPLGISSTLIIGMIYLFKILINIYALNGCLKFKLKR